MSTGMVRFYRSQVLNPCLNLKLLRGGVTEVIAQLPSITTKDRNRVDFRNSGSCDLGQRKVGRQEKYCLVTRDSPFISCKVCNFQ